MKRYRKPLVLLTRLSAGGAIFVVCVLILRAIDCKNSDFLAFWLAGRLILRGLSPYSPSAWTGGYVEIGASWISDRTFLYPLPLAYPFVPFALLALDCAFAGWLLLSTFSIAGSLMIIVRPYGGKPWRIVLPLVAGAFLFRPTILSCLNGQLAPLILALLTAARVKDRTETLG